MDMSGQPHVLAVWAPQPVWSFFFLTDKSPVPARIWNL